MTTDHPHTTPELPDTTPGVGRSVGRRGVVAAVAVAGVGGATLAGCGSTKAKTPVRPTAPETLGAATDVPVGGGHVFTDQNVVVTQPAAGTYKGFSATCTHAGCQVDTVSDGFIHCPCHGSRFAITDGAPTSDSPARTPLPAITVTVQGADLVAQP